MNAEEEEKLREEKLREILRREWDKPGQWFHVQLFLAYQLEKLGEEEFKRIAREEGVPEGALK